LVDREGLASALAKDLEEPAVERALRQQFSKNRDDSLGLSLETEYLEAAVVEAIDRVFVSPVVG
jgi:hypothetical protein